MLYCRQAFLRENFAFHCACERCTGGADEVRMLPCPRCLPRDAKGLLPPDVVFLKDPAAKEAVLRYSAVTAASSGSSSDDSSTLPWRCSKCGLQLPDEDLALFGGATAAAAERVEETAARLVHSYDAMLEATKCADCEKVCTLVAVVGRHLAGGQHWAFIRALLLHAGESLAARMNASSQPVP